MSEIEVTKEDTTQYLKYDFTLEERASLSERMAEAVGVKVDNELRLKEASSQMKATIAAQDSIISDSASKLRQGYEYRNIPCTIIRDFKAGTYQVARNDTGEKVEDRILREDELQLKLNHE